MNQPFPDDADGDALRRVVDAGNDLLRPMEIDFFVAVPDEASGQRVAAAAEKAGYHASLELDDEDGSLTCCCTKTMLATYDGVIQVQAELDALSEPFGGFTDGWGTMGNAG